MNKIKKYRSFFYQAIVTACIVFNLLFSILSIQASVSASVVEETDEASTPSAAVHPQMPFKLGFEFQENNNLCKWALNNNLVQKKPIFGVIDIETGCPLWDLVIDTSDIEFVTHPFAFNQRPLLQKCVSTIHQSFSKLVEMLNRQEEGVSFRQLLGFVQETLGSGYNVLVNDEVMRVVAERSLQRPSPDWNPGFSPQATIQHPLELTIPLYFNLFGHDRITYNVPFAASLPYMDVLKEAMKTGDSDSFGKIIDDYVKNKTFGLVFLHALTLFRMTPEEDDNDAKLLEETSTSLKNYQQVDVKMKLPIMSRRPFSLMWHELQEMGIRMHYVELFGSAMSKNRAFIFSSKVPQLFQRTNYAEQFFSSTTGEVVSLLKLTPFFNESFYRLNREVIDHLLRQGVISTTMVRNFAENAGVGDFLFSNLLKDYSKRAIQSIQVPERNRYKLDPERGLAQNIDWGYDVISPPLLLDPTNSMGHFNQPLKPGEKHYGEAIVEIRAISDVAKRFLEKAHLNTEKQGKFLKEASAEMEIDALALFDFLNKFGKRDINDFIVGLPYTILRGSLAY